MSRTVSETGRHMKRNATETWFLVKHTPEMSYDELFLLTATKK